MPRRARPPAPPALTPPGALTPGVDGGAPEPAAGVAPAAGDAAWLRAALAAAGVELWEWTASDDRLLVTPGLALLAGRDPAAFPPTMREYLAVVVHPDDRVRVEREARASVARRRLPDGTPDLRPTPYHSEYRLRVPEGAPERWVEVHGELRRDGAGQPQRMLGTIRDATARIRAERALRMRDAWLRRMVASLPVGAVFCEGDRLLCNPAIERLTGYTSAELSTVGDWFARLYGAEAATVRGYYEADRAAGFGSTRVVPLTRADGQVLLVECAAAAAGDAAVWVIHDVTAREAAEARLRASEQRFRSLIENASDAISVVEPSGRIVYASPAYPRVLGYAPEAMEGMNGFTLVHPDDRGAVAATLAELVQTPGALATAEYRARHADGSWRTMAVRATNLVHDPAVRGVVVNSRDVTAQRSLEAQLRQAQKMEAVGRLAGGVAHDFNNLLTVIRTYVELAAEALEPAHPARADLAEVLAGTDRAAALTRQLLAFGRRQPMHPQLVDPAAVVAGMEPMLRHLIGGQLQLVVAAERGEGVVLVDPAQLEQVVLNLAVNARDAMPGGGVLVLETGVGAPGADGAPRLAVRVSDTGVGMDVATRSRIFEPFFTTKPPGKGTGLGLATVHGIVTQAGGEVRVTTTPGEGTTFEVLLPRHEAVGGASPDAEEDAATAPAAAAPARGGGETILVAEDEAAVRLSVRRILERAGYRVLEARHGGDALLAWQRERPAIALVLSDVVMPEMGGAELAAALRREDPAVRLLFMSGYTGGRLGELPGPILGKPFAAEELLRQVREALERG